MIQRQRAIRDNNVLTWREDSEGLICLCPSQHTTSRNKKKAAIPSPKTNIEKKRNKKRFFLSQKKFSRNEMERAILGGGRSFQFNGRTLRGAAYRLHRRICYTKKEPPRRISEVLKVAATSSTAMQCRSARVVLVKECLEWHSEFRARGVPTPRTKRGT